MTVEVHAELHERAVRNLIENALTHTPPGTEVEVIVGPGREIKVYAITAPAFRSSFEARFSKGFGGRNGSGAARVSVLQ